MVQHPAPPSSPETVRFLEPVVRPIVKATDLGSVQVLKQGNLFLLTDPFGDVHPDTRGLGLYEGDTRRLSCSILRVNGQRPVLLQASAGGNYTGTIQLTNPRIERNLADKVHPEDALATQKLGIGRHRLLTGDVLEERVTLVNYAEESHEIEIELEFAADAADIFEVRGWTRPARGAHLPVALRGDRMTFRYDALDGVRMETHLAFTEAWAEAGPVDPEIAGGANAGWVRACWRWELATGEARELRWTAWTTERPTPAGADHPEALFPPSPRVDEDPIAASYRAWTSGFTEIRTDNELFNLSIIRSADDLRLLLNDGPGDGDRYLAAGVPWFTTLFGRDALITAFQALAVRPQLAIDTLETLAALQGDADDPERDMEPGKILHELRTGEMARNGETPHTPYYGTADATPLWLILLGATYDWTGDRAVVDRLWPNALRALEWIDAYGDRDGDGFVEYERRSDRGLLNQGWKDSSDGIRDRHGRLAHTPIALAEVQGYVFDAKRRMAALARLRGDAELAGRLEGDAEALRRRFEDAFWSDEQGMYAMALDGSKARMDAIGSNAGHCLWSGLVAPERAARVVQRLMAPDMFSGWGVRTYAAGQVGYNPIGYHTGTVWPHDVSLIAAGFKRYGFHDEANLLCGRIFEASQHFPEFRLPELFCGFDRDVSPVPVPYPVACSPQAWAAGSVFLFLETMLGLRPHAAARELELARPELPAWLTKVTVRNLRVGDGDVDLLFHRWRGGTSAEVIRKSQDLSVTIRM
ncbi:MAG TPA: glycogen debranching N-terminal domain-containing protein [Candidatus Limnocylindrales bacterium]|nr:glycogen debranching N-terminal domain-containing protein [Candidatus Limnocylindrales bacterium]